MVLFYHYLFASQLLDTKKGQLSPALKRVALQEGLSETTVLEIFKKKDKEKHQGVEKGLVRVLGVDEISVRKGHKNYALVLTALERRCVREVFDNRLHAARWVEPTTEASYQSRVNGYVEPIRYAIKRKLVKAKIVADRFHVVKQLNHQLNLLRRKLQRQANEQLVEILKGRRWILLKNRVNLTPKEEKKLILMLAASPELRPAYLLKEEFRAICNNVQGVYSSMLDLDH